VKASFDLGLSDTAADRDAWRKNELGWYGLAKIVTHKAAGKNVGDMDNDITCMHSSQSPDRVDYVRWTANIFNSADAVTPSKFKELCLAYVRKLGCRVPGALFVQVNPSDGQFFETDEATFKLERLKYKIGHGWQFTVTAKLVAQ